MFSTRYAGFQNQLHRYEYILQPGFRDFCQHLGHHAITAFAAKQEHAQML